MKSVLSSVDLVCVVRELDSLRGSFVQKVYQVDDEFIFHFYGSGVKSVLRFVAGRLIHLTNYVKENPEVPTNFCMYLRKYFNGARLESVSQPRLERVIAIRFSTKSGFLKVFVELFGSGNVIVTDDNDVIKQCLHVQRFSSRVIKSGVKYDLPPSDFYLSDSDFVSFKRVIKSSDKPDIVRCLAVDVGLGGSYAEEVCISSLVDKSVKPSLASDDIVKACFDSFLGIIKKVKYAPISAECIFSGDKVVDVTPFHLIFYDNNKSQSFVSFNEALDFFYARSERLSFDEEKTRLFESRRNKLLERLKSADDYVAELKSKSSLIKERALSLKSNLYLVERVIKSLFNARKGGYSWVDINSMLEREAGSAEASLIKELIPDENLVILDLADGLRVPINVNVTDFMNDLFEESKKFEGKIDGAVEAVDRVKRELDSLSPDKLEVGVSVPKRIDSSGKEWFERFKWFRTSEGLLVIAGRDALQNEELINKYLEPDDLVFHAEIHGSPFAILRNGRKAGEASKFEAAQFTAVHSNAWVEGVAIDVFYVLPYQVSKTPPSGEYLRTGGFMIKGKKEFFKNVKLEFSLGVEVIGELSYRLISGPVSAVKSRSSFLFVLETGSKSKTEVAKDLIDRFKAKGFVFSFENMQSVLPSSGFRII